MGGQALDLTPAPFMRYSRVGLRVIIQVCTWSTPSKGMFLHVVIFFLLNPTGMFSMQDTYTTNIKKTS